MALNIEQINELKQICQSISDTNFGQGWPKEYDTFFRTWGYFNSIYDTLYSGIEWKKIAQFALDNSFSSFWPSLKQMSQVKELAKLPCVGDGRDNFAPSENIRIAFHTLRVEFNILDNSACNTQKCIERQQRNQIICQNTNWPAIPSNLCIPENAKFTPLGATLTIIYQIRNNLFHGSKREFKNSEGDRNKKLVTVGESIVRKILEEILPTIGNISTRYNSHLPHDHLLS